MPCASGRSALAIFAEIASNRTAGSGQLSKGIAKTMSVYRRTSGKWAVRIDADRDPEGKRVRHNLGTFATKKDAESAERKALEAHERGFDLAPRTTTLGEVVERFLRDVATRLSPTTVQRYEELWRLHAAPKLWSIPLGKLRPAHIVDLYASLASQTRPRVRRGEERPLSAHTIHHVHRFLHRVLGWAEKLSLVERNVVRTVEAPRPGPSPARALTANEGAALLAAAEGSQWHTFVLVALMTGARRGELHGLRWDAIDFERATVTFRQSLCVDRRKRGPFLKSTRTGRERVVPLATPALDVLRRHRAAQAAEKLAAGTAYDDRGFVFVDALGALLHPDRSSKAFADIARRAGIADGHLHLSRHSAATWALANGSDVRTVAAMLGHSAPSTTLNVYGHVVAGLQRTASDGLAETLRLAQARRAGAQKGLS